MANLRGSQKTRQQTVSRGYSLLHFPGGWPTTSALCATGNCTHLTIRAAQPSLLSVFYNQCVFTRVGQIFLVEELALVYLKW